MQKYTAVTNHSKDTITLMAKTQYLTFAGGKRLAMLVMCIVFIALALLGDFSQGVTIIFLALGCLPFTAINLPAKQRAEAAIEELKGSFPTIEYSFEDDGMHVRNGERSEVVKYQDIIRLVLDESYAYLFIRNRSGYMVALASVEPRDSEAFERDVAERVGLKWTRNKGLLGVSVRSLIFNRRNTRK